MSDRIRRLQNLVRQPTLKRPFIVRECLARWAVPGFSGPSLSGQYAFIYGIERCSSHDDGFARAASADRHSMVVEAGNPGIEKSPVSSEPFLMV